MCGFYEGPECLSSLSFSLLIFTVVGPKVGCEVLVVLRNEVIHSLIYSFIQQNFSKLILCVTLLAEDDTSRVPVSASHPNSWDCRWGPQRALRPITLSAMLQPSLKHPNRASFAFPLHREANPGPAGRCPAQGHAESRVELGYDEGT